MVLTQEHLEHIEIHITDILPKILTRNPDIATTIEGILAQHFPRRDEFARLLDEVYESRQEMGGLRQRMDNLDQNVGELRGEVGELRGEIGELREEMNERFKGVDKNFLEVKRELAKLRSGQETNAKRLDKQEDWFNFIMGNTRVEKGRSAEDLVAAALSYGLKANDLDPETIRLRQPLRDPEGLVFHSTYNSDLDLIACNGAVTLFEVKFSYVKKGEPTYFAQKIHLYRLQNPELAVKGLFISPGADDEILKECEEVDIQLLR